MRASGFPDREDEVTQPMVLPDRFNYSDEGMGMAMRTIGHMYILH